MGKTTIQVSKKLKDDLSTFGSKSETYETIFRRIYEFAIKDRLRDFVMSSEGFIPIEEAIRRHDKKWSK